MPFSGRGLLHYEVMEPIGACGLGVVYEARDTQMDRYVSLTVVRPDLAPDPGRRRRFEHEVRAASALNHPNIAAVLDVASDGPFDVVVMEHLTGYTPFDRLSGERFSPSETLRYALPIVGAIATAHAAGLVHGRLAPCSILLAEQGRVKVLDFGLSAIAAGVSLAGTVATSPSPAVPAGPSLSGGDSDLSPDHAPGEVIDPRTDVFSLGAIVYEMLTGARPSGEVSPESVQTAAADEPNPSALGDVPPALAAIVMQCLRKDRDARFASATELLSALEACRTQLEQTASVPSNSGRSWTPRRSLYFLTAAVVLVIAIVYSARAYQRYRGARWATTRGIAEVVELADAGRIEDAFTVAARVESFLPATPLLQQLWPVVARDLAIETVPSGAGVFRKPYDAPDAPWQPVGRTPLQVRVPRDLGRWRIEKAGFATVEGSLTNSVDGDGADSLRIALDRLEDTPPGMVRVPGRRESRLDLLGYDGLPPRTVPDFWIDRLEVTNRQFKLFIDGGGYQNRELWTHPIVRAGTTLDLRDAAAVFSDTTGRTAPASWTNGDFPADHAEHPVTDVSWYEAAAYCASVGKHLPTIWHWNAAAGIRTSASVLPASNFGAPGPAPVGRFTGLGPWGTYDMAGNVKEWSLTPAAPDRRYVLGGGWREAAPAFLRADIQDPLARRPDIGFRCVKHTAETEPGPAADMLTIANRDYGLERPCSDDLFRFFKSLYDYHPKPLNPRVERIDDTGGYRTERVSFDAAYGQERVIAYLFLPATATPLQTVVFLPGTGLFQAAPPPAFMPEFLLKSGRAVLIPALKGTFERRDGYVSDIPNTSPIYRDRIVAWGKDLRRSLEYLQTRPDIDSRKIAYYGTGLGAQLGPIMSVVEDRFSANVWGGGGLKPQHSLPEVDGFQFAPRVRAPTLMLGHRYDFAYPLEVSQRPLFRSVGVPADRKRHVVFETSPVPAHTQITPVLDWLDRYLGRVH